MSKRNNKYIMRVVVLAWIFRNQITENNELLKGTFIYIISIYNTYKYIRPCLYNMHLYVIYTTERNRILFYSIQKVYRVYRYYIGRYLHIKCIIICFNT